MINNHFLLDLDYSLAETGIFLNRSGYINEEK